MDIRLSSIVGSFCDTPGFVVVVVIECGLLLNAGRRRRGSPRGGVDTRLSSIVGSLCDTPGFVVVVVIECGLLLNAGAAGEVDRFAQGSRTAASDDACRGPPFRLECRP
ncbi:hypothetical protein BW730_02205 [Tessaracoccus aquimaris]|uniref:Uncharacterized protein n=1 Tax=Tessaracoccus aquimaris TaxID=1332264 RepID=A0A1Q2CK98_9ACTN|nr:hypothetical protein BW730_02205 [Tessaracoccus aquimaris]